MVSSCPATTTSASATDIHAKCPRVVQATGERLHDLVIDSLAEAASNGTLHKYTGGAAHPYFDSLTFPKGSVAALKSFFSSARHYKVLDDNAVFVALHYLSRLCSLGEKRIVLTESNLASLVVTACMIAHKSLEDQPYDNNSFSRLSGINKEELNKLELHFMGMLEWNAHARLEDIQFIASHFPEPAPQVSQMISEHNHLEKGANIACAV